MGLNGRTSKGKPITVRGSSTGGFHNMHGAGTDKGAQQARRENEALVCEWQNERKGETWKYIIAVSDEREQRV